MAGTVQYHPERVSWGEEPSGQSGLVNMVMK